MLEELACAQNKVVGTKQTKRCLQRNEVLKVYLAADVDGKLKSEIVKDCSDAGVDVVIVESMEWLGIKCGIEVKAAMVAILKD